MVGAQDAVAISVGPVPGTNGATAVFPEEIVSRIFEYYMEERPEFSGCKSLSQILSTAPTPSTLRLVCSDWNAIALNTPSLWTTIHVAVYIASRHWYKAALPFTSKKHMQAVRACLGRARNHPCSIYIHAFERPTGKITLRPTRAVTVVDLVDCISTTRMKQVYLNGDHVALLHPLALVTFSHTTSLVISKKRWTERTLRFPKFPALRKVVFQLPHLPPNGDCRHMLPWMQLTHLYCEHTISPIFIETILSYCQLLQKAAFHTKAMNANEVGWQPLRQSAHILGDLTHLYFIGEFPLNHAFAIEMPKLSHLRIVHGGGPMTWNQVNLDKFASLTFLRLHGITGNLASHLIPILDAAPLLSRLELGFMRWVEADTIFDFFIFDPAEPRATKLEHLELQLHLGTKGSKAREKSVVVTNSLWAMIKSRMDGDGSREDLVQCAALKSLTLLVPASPGRAVQDDVDDVRSVLDEFYGRLEYNVLETPGQRDFSSGFGTSLRHWDDGFEEVLNRLHI